MLRLAAILILMSATVSVARDKGGDFDACSNGQVTVAGKASDYQGEDRIKRLIQADLSRARKEEAEGDADECLEALDHANKLMAGQY